VATERVLGAILLTLSYSQLFLVGQEQQAFLEEMVFNLVPCGHPDLNLSL
jgi:hypothetical protein